MRDYVIKARFDKEGQKKLEYCAGYFGVTKSRLIEMQIEDLYDKLSKAPGDDSVGFASIREKWDTLKKKRFLAG